MKKTIFSLLLAGSTFLCRAENPTATPAAGQNTNTCPTAATVAAPATCETKPAACPVKAAPATEAAKPACPASSAAVVIRGNDGQWDFFSLALWFDVPYSTSYSNVCGIKIGAPFCSGKGVVRGLETAVFCGATDHIQGMQACILVSKSEKVSGMQFSIVNYATEISGLQLGVVNVSQKKSFQLGIVNYIEDAAIPFMPICNFKF